MPRSASGPNSRFRPGRGIVDPRSESGSGHQLFQIKMHLSKITNEIKGFMSKPKTRDF